MFLKQLKQLTLSATRRKSDVVRLARFYGSSAVCETVTTSKAPRRLSKDERRVLVECFVSEYRAANDGKFPSYSATQKAVRGSYNIVKVLLQEMKLKPEAPLPIVAEVLSEESASVPNLKDPQSHVSACIAKDPLPIVAEALSEVSASVPNDASSVALNDMQPHVFVCNVKEPLPIVAKALLDESVSVPNDASSQTMIDTDTDPQSHSSACNAKDLSATVGDPVLQADTIEIGSDQKQATMDSYYSDEVNLMGNDLVTAAAHDRKEIETAFNSDLNSKCDLFESQVVIEECLKNVKTGEEENLSHLGSEETKEGRLEGPTVSENIEPSVTRQDSEKGVVQAETEEKSSAWSNIMSFAKEFANFWRKG